MTKGLSIFLPVVVLMALSQASVHFAETPYPVSPFHPYVILLSGFASWFCFTLGAIRNSYALIANGVAFLSLALANTVFPDLWLRIPHATLLCFTIGQLGTLVFFNTGASSPRGYLFPILLSVSFSLSPYLVALYYPSFIDAPFHVAVITCLILGIIALIALSRHPRKFHLLSGLLFLFWLGLITLLVTACMGPEVLSSDVRHRVEEAIFSALILIVIFHLSTQLSLEKGLRSGPHMNLDESMKDALTRLANRRALDLYGPRLIKQSFEAGKAVSVIISDIDHFKQINDLHGHAVGDLALQKVSSQLARQVRKSDLVVRYGGEEFIIILTGSPLAPAIRLAELMRSAIENEVIHLESSHTLHLTASFGVSTAFPEAPVTLTDLIKQADKNLYRAKNAGRNQVQANSIVHDDF